MQEVDVRVDEFHWVTKPLTKDHTKYTDQSTDGKQTSRVWCGGRLSAISPIVQRRPGPLLNGKSDVFGIGQSSDGT
jgi:hypothetical protein